MAFMKWSCRVVLALLALCGSASCWASCSGSLVGVNIPVVHVLAEARLAYLGEVVGLKLLTAQPRHNTFASYEVVFRSVTVLKGKVPRLQRGTFQRMYYEAPPPSSGQSGDLNELLVTDRGRSFDFGQKYLILARSAKPLGKIGTCDQRVVGLSPEVMTQLQALPDER